MEIAEIKSRLTMPMVLHHYNLKPDKSHRLHCPFHEDRTPSFQLYYKTQTGYCFSSNCKTHGKKLDVIDFIMYKESVTKHEAILKAKEMAGALNTGAIPKAATPQPPPAPTANHSQVLQNMFTYFKNAVHNSRPAQDYIKRRGLDATRLEIGYNTGQFYHGARRDETLIQDCVNVGLLAPWGVNTKNTEQQAYKAFAKCCISFALRDSHNNITGLYFRSTINDTDQKHFYLKGSTGLYPSYPKAATQKLILTESIIDAATLLQDEAIAKEYGIIAAYGTNRLNEEMQTAINGLKQLKEIVFAFDSDAAGGAATAKYAAGFKSQNEKLTISQITLPCKDINETLQAHNEAVFHQLLEERTSLSSSGEPPQPIVFSNENKTATHQTLNTTNPNKLSYTTATATYYIRGGIEKAMHKLGLTLEIYNEALQNGIDKRRFRIDLYDNKQVEKAIAEASEHLQLPKPSLEQDIHDLTELLDDYREQQQHKDDTAAEQEQQGQPYVLTTIEKESALQIANDKNLIQAITEKLGHTGIVGEDNNKTFLYIIAASHIQENPLNALIQGSSGSGKTNLLKGIYKTIPEESKKIYSRCSEKMLYNVPKYYFQNKLICFEDVDGLGEEAEYAWRELVSNGELISGVSYKDEKGNIGIKELTVYGPITSIACTTKGAIYADNMSRLFLIAIDESKAQTQRINEYQAREAAGQINRKTQTAAIKQLQDFSRILQPYKVYNPYATHLKLPEDIQDERRLYKLYLHFIEIITVLHQYQRRKTKDGKLITEKQDCQIAKDLLFECIMLKMDELDGSLRQFFERLKAYAHQQNSTGHEFTQREIRQALQVKKTSLSYYINALQRMEYLQQTSHHINKGSRYRITHFDNYRKLREDVKAFLQQQIDHLS